MKHIFLTRNMVMQPSLPKLTANWPDTFCPLWEAGREDMMASSNRSCETLYYLMISVPGKLIWNHTSQILISDVFISLASDLETRQPRLSRWGFWANGPLVRRLWDLWGLWGLWGYGQKVQKVHEVHEVPPATSTPQCMTIKYCCLYDLCNFWDICPELTD